MRPDDLESLASPGPIGPKTSAASLHRDAGRRAARLVPLVAAGALIAASAAGLLASARDADARFPGLAAWLADSEDRIAKQARHLLREPYSQSAEQAVAVFKRLLVSDPVSPYRWADLGAAYLQKGKAQKARYCFEQALKFGPKIPKIQVLAADFFSIQGEHERAMRLAAQALAVRRYDKLIFGYYERTRRPTEDVLNYGVPAEPGPARAYFQHLIREGRPERIRRAWEWLAGRGLATDYSLRSYVSFLLARGLFSEAISAMADFRPEAATDRRGGNLVFNPSFEFETTGAALDWRLPSSQTVRAAIDSARSAEGNRSVRVELDDARLRSGPALAQRIVLGPGRYELSLQAACHGLPPGHNLCFRVRRPGRGGSLAETASLPCDGDWRRLTAEFDAPKQTVLADLELADCAVLPREISFQGTVRADAVQLRMVE